MDFETKDSGARREFASGAVRDRRAGKGRYDLLPPRAIDRLAKVYERGAEKYGDRNWEKGIPEGDLMDSALRHCFMYQQGKTDEDHLMQAVFNLMAVVELQELAPQPLPLTIKGVPDLREPRNTVYTIPAEDKEEFWHDH